MRDNRGVNLLDDLQWRGLIQDSTDLDELRKHLAAGPVTFYVGFDPTAASLHLGHLMQVITARRLQLAGHRPLLLVGGATGQIGDPKEAGERNLNPPEVIAGWVERIRAQLAPFVTYTGDNAARLVNNLDWTAEMSAIEFLRDVGKHFPVNRMLARDVVKSRLESGISFTEFAYQLLQSHDYFELNQRHGCTLQFGGSDQWGNITAGVDYIRRRASAMSRPDSSMPRPATSLDSATPRPATSLDSVHAFTTPLVTKSDGTKFGKTEGGAIWLDPELTSAYAFYQFWVNTDDGDVMGYLKYFSFADHDALAELDKATAERPAAREAQRALARELTTLVHGADECAQVIAASQALFGRGSLAELSPTTLAAALAEAGLVELSTLPAAAVLFKEAGLVSSLNEARRTIAEGGAYINNERVTDPEHVPDTATLLHGRYLVLRRGKRNFAGASLTP
jgi:tyrosyl-tRNA synthetase